MPAATTASSVTVSVPRPDIASRAFTARLMSTCSSCTRSASIGQASLAVRSSSLTPSPMSRSSMWLVSTSTAFRSSGRIASTCLRPKASSCLVRSLPRRAASWISRRSLPGGAALAGLGQQQIGVAADHHQDVVEVVRDAAGQLADGFQLLRLSQLGLEPAPVFHLLLDPPLERLARPLGAAAGAAEQPHAQECAQDSRGDRDGEKLSRWRQGQSHVQSRSNGEATHESVGVYRRLVQFRAGSGIGG